MRLQAAWVWLLFGLIAVAVLEGVSSSSRGSAALDSSDGGEHGALAAYLWLQKLGYHVTRTKSLATAARYSPESLLVFRQDSSFSQSDVAAIEARLNAGAFVAVALDGSYFGRLVPGIHARLTPIIPGTPRIVQPLVSPPATMLDGDATGAVQLDGSTTLAQTPDGAALVALAWGPGRLWLLTASDLFDNRHLGRADNARLLLNLVGPRSREVVFLDHQAALPDAAPSNWLTGSSWGAAAVLASCILVLYRWSAGRRLGPAVVSLSLRHRPLAEYAFSLGDLLRRGNKREDALRAYQGELRRTIAGQEQGGGRIPGNARSQAEALLAQNSAPVTDSDLVHRVEAIVEMEKQVRSSHV